MTRPRIRAALLAAGAGLATGYASVSDFTGVIHGHYTGTGAGGVPAAGRKDALGHRAVAPPPAGTGHARQAAEDTAVPPLWPARCRRTMAVSFWRAARPGGGREQGRWRR
jgi:hypothetical protein